MLTSGVLAICDIVPITLVTLVVVIILTETTAIVSMAAIAKLLPGEWRFNANHFHSDYIEMIKTII